MQTLPQETDAGESVEDSVSEIGKILEAGVDRGECTPAWAASILDLIKESEVIKDRPGLYTANIIHQSLRAEASKDGPPVSRIATMRAPDLGVGRNGGLSRIALPEELPESISDFYELVERRHSTPMFGTEPLGLGELSAVLKASFGSKGFERGYQRRDIPRRVAPSAGGLQSYDCQVIANDVRGLFPGRYSYDPLTHELVLEESGDFRLPLLEASIESGFIVHAHSVIAITGNFPRVSWKYGTRGYRYMGMDAGIVIGHVYLAATALGLSVNAVAAFADDKANQLLRLDGTTEFTQILITLGTSPGS